jgi:PAS domain-containing protein
MTEAEELSDVVGLVYDASLDPSLWPTVLEQTCRFLGCVSGTINSYDVTRSSLSINASWGHDPHYTRLLLDHYIHINPLKAISLQSKVGDVFSVAEVANYAEVTDTPFWREWARPQGYVDAMEAKLDRTPTASAALTVIRHEDVGRVDETALRRLRLLYPHFRRAVLIGKVIDLKRVEAAAFADIIDGMLAAIFLLDSAGRIVYANPSGQAMLSECEVFVADRTRLAPRDAAADRSIRDALAAAEGDGQAKLDGEGIAIPLSAANGGRYVAHVLPLTSGARRAAGLHYAAVAAVFVRKAELEPTSERQADLVRLVAGYASPLGR